jgi:hypothetical protein
MKIMLRLLMLALLSASLVGCGGGGSPASDPSILKYEDSWPIRAALSVAKTSYENKNDPGILRSQIDDIKSLPGITSFEANELGSEPRSLTLADFYHEGQRSAFVVVNRSGGDKGKVYFLRWKDDSKWVDDTSRILADRRACVNSRYAITADFNQDQKPDVFLSCGDSIAEQQLVFLSSASGAYTRIETGISIKGMRAAAADLDGDNSPDVVANINGAVLNAPSMLIYKGDGRGGFSAQPTWLTDCFGSSGNPVGYTPPEIPSNIQQVFLMPTAAGRTDLFVSGEVSSGKSQMWFRGLSVGPNFTPPYFTNCHNTATTAKGFSASLVSSNDAVLLDLFYASIGGTPALYGYMQTSDGLVASLKKFEVLSDSALNLNALPSVFTNPSRPATGFVSQFRLNGSNQLISYDAGCNGTAASSRCGMTFALR